MSLKHGDKSSIDDEAYPLLNGLSKMESHDLLCFMWMEYETNIAWVDVSD